MVQDIKGKLNIGFVKDMTAQTGDFVLHLVGRQILVRDSAPGESPEEIFPRFEELMQGGVRPDSCPYLFTLEGEEKKKFFLCIDEEIQIPEGFRYADIHALRRTGGNEVALIAFTGLHLSHWYRTSRFCGACGTRMNHGTEERVMVCPSCGNMVYPRINPAVIVGVISPDHKKLLVTRYARSRGVKVNALVAGFTEIGETFEDTVRREVMEEVGLRVKNIRYYKSQPWGIANDILAGFYCEAEEDQEVRLDEGELQSAIWQTDEEIVGQPDDLSLTNEMMMNFKYHGRYKKI